MKNLIKGLTVVGMLSLCSCARVLHTSNAQNANKLELSAVKNTGTVNGIYHNDTLTPLRNGFAHNDYCHKRPLYDALENGFTNIEADIFLQGDKLIVAHIFPFFKDRRTLEALYLKPLADRIAQNGGTVFTGYNSPVTLMIDIKTNAEKTYQALKPLLEKYRSILSGCENGKMIYRAVTIVISGHKPYAAIRSEHSRLAFIDEDLFKLATGPADNNLISMASCKYSKLLSWNGDGVFPLAEKSKLCAFVAQAHGVGARVRLWASPENKQVWDELLACGVDLINTDELATLKNYLTRQQPQRPVNNQQSIPYAQVVLPGIRN